MVNATSSAVTGSPSCHRAPSRRTKVHVRPLGSTDQRSARSGTIVPPGPFRTRPEKTSATRSRSAWLCALNGLTETGRPRMPSRYGRDGCDDADGVGRAAIEPALLSDGTPTRPAITASRTTRVPTTNESVRVIELRVDDRSRRTPRCRDQAAGGRGEDERRQREDDEQDEQDDRELPQPALDAPAAAIDGGIAAECPRQADPAGLQQDGHDERDAHQDLADGQQGVHDVDSSERFGDGCYHKIRGDRPVIPAQRGMSAKVEERRRDVGEDAVVEGQTARRTTDQDERDGVERVRRDGPAGGIAELVGVAVVGGDREQRARRVRVARVHGRRPRRRSGRDSGRWPRGPRWSRPRPRCGRPCRRWRSWRR